ncbi:Fic/DOC family N-terminal domain-containing protein [Acrocarpospora sp. B8E8]|uniref:Fic family protein n=1 Tax=Acrocarpospora sp. B8E8 TaxID=3153572 RepID=UPI00325C3EBA
MPQSLSLENETIMALSDAEAALGRLSGVARRLREPDLLLRPYAVREALASARIEGTQARLTDVFQAEAAGAEPAYGDLRDLHAHLRAAEHGVREVRSRRLDLELLLQLHAMLMHGSARTASGGRLRDQPVWIGSPTDRPDNAVFVPPIGQAMHDSLADFEAFLLRPPRLPTLVRCALLHYQFLTVHPLLDGNGRIGRLLVLLFLIQEERLPVPLLYLSAYFERHRVEYYDRLQAVREKGRIQEWLQFFLTAVSAQADDAMQRADSLLTLREQYRSELAGNRSRASEAIELVFDNPILTTRLVRSSLGVTNQGALNLIRHLEGRGWLSKLEVRQGRGGSVFWLAPQVYAVISDEPAEGYREGEASELSTQSTESLTGVRN